MGYRSISCALWAALAIFEAPAADIVLKPDAGGGVSFMNATGAITRFRVTEGGNTTLGGTLALPDTPTTIFAGGNRFIHTVGNRNVFMGRGSGNPDMTGAHNTAVGWATLGVNASGSNNTVMGESALSSMQGGNDNLAIGAKALMEIVGPTENTAVGANALMRTTTGNRNVALGFDAGSELITGSDNIFIGNLGISGDNDTIRIGSSAQTKTFITGIRARTTGNANAIAVMIDSAGQLGTISSSARTKDDISDMDTASSDLMKLRPVTFHYLADQDPAGRTLQYGLVAEEVAEVYPGLVAQAPDGSPETVMYQFLPPMLLNEFQKQQRTIAEQAGRIEAQAAELGLLQRRLARIEAALGAKP